MHHHHSNNFFKNVTQQEASSALWHIRPQQCRHPLQQQPQYMHLSGKHLAGCQLICSDGQPPASAAVTQQYISPAYRCLAAVLPALPVHFSDAPPADTHVTFCCGSQVAKIAENGMKLCSARVPGVLQPVFMSHFSLAIRWLHCPLEKKAGD